MDLLGRIVEETTPVGFLFRLEKNAHVPLHEYVVVEVDEQGYEGVKRVKVLGEVIRLGAKNPLATERLVTEPIESSPYTYELAYSEALGYLEDDTILRPKSAPKPNSIVYKADDIILQQFFRGNEDRLPLYVGNLVHRKSIKVPIHIQDLQFHLGVFAQTRSGKSFFAGKIIEEIMKNTPFPVIVIDIHGDYVMMDRDVKDSKHGEFDVVVYYPPGAPKVPGVTANEKELTISPNKMTNEAVAELLGNLGPRQAIVLRNILRSLRTSGKPFGLGDIIERVRQEAEKITDKEEKKRYESIVVRLEDVEEEVQLPADGLSVRELLKPKTLNIICLRGLRSRIQDAYTGIIVDLIFRNHVASSGEYRKAPPTFLFVEEAHRVAAKEGGSRYAVKAISTAIREGAKFGLYITLISQRPRSIDPDVLSNVGNYAVLRITNQLDQSMIEHASESFTHRLVEDLPALNQGEVVLVGPYVPLPAQIRVLSRLSKHHGVTPNLRRIKEEMEREMERMDKERW